MLLPVARRLLDRIADRPATYLDVGAGTGALALAAADRWRAARVFALDASAGMLSVGRRRVAETRPVADAGRFAWLAADAARMPLDTATVDVATAAFTLDVVDDRAAVLAEIARVLRPGGRFGMVGWIGEEVALAADAAFDEAVRASRVDVADAAPRALSAPDVMSVSGVRDELAAAGFVEIDARAGELCHAWTPASYLEFKQHFDEHELFDSLVPSQHRALVDAVTAGWSGLPAAAFELRAPIVCALARTPG